MYSLTLVYYIQQAYLGGQTNFVNKDVWLLSQWIVSDMVSSIICGKTLWAVCILGNV